MNDTLTTLVNYENLIQVIELTKGRRPIYYNESNTPKKYKRVYDSKGRLIVNGQPVIKNIKSVNKPRTLRINFNLFWAGNVHRSARTKIKDTLHTFFKSSTIKDIKSFPIVLHFEYYTNNKADADNGSFIYIKTFLDTLTELKIIPDDDRRYIRGYSWVTYTGDSKLVVKYEYRPDID